MPALEFKKDPYLLAFAAFLVGCAVALVMHHDVTVKEAAGFLTGALAFPGLFGRKDPQS